MKSVHLELMREFIKSRYKCLLEQEISKSSSKIEKIVAPRCFQILSWDIFHQKSIESEPFELQSCFIYQIKALKKFLVQIWHRFSNPTASSGTTNILNSRHTLQNQPSKKKCLMQVNLQLEIFLKQRVYCTHKSFSLN